MEKPKIGFVAFFLMWANVQKWKVPMLHIRICMWLESCHDPVRVLMVFRGGGKVNSVRGVQILATVLRWNMGVTDLGC